MAQPAHAAAVKKAGFAQPAVDVEQGAGVRRHIQRTGKQLRVKILCSKYLCGAVGRVAADQGDLAALRRPVEYVLGHWPLALCGWGEEEEKKGKEHFHGPYCCATGWVIF